MAGHQTSIDVRVPVSTAYDQWTQFESFPHFMEGVESVTQITDDRLHWVAEIAGARREWDAEIVEQIPDQRIAWMSLDGTRNGGIVSFQPIDADTTRVELALELDPHGVVEHVGDKLGFVSRQIEADLARFKEFIESRGVETGAWRGTIENS